MTDVTPPAKHYKPFTVTGWFIGNMVIGAIVCIILGALFVLMLGDRFFNFGDDPASHFQETHNDLDGNPPPVATIIPNMVAPTPPAITAMQDTIAKTAQQAADLQQRVEQIDQAKQQDQNTGAIMLGVTQLKTAADDDQPLQPGIDTLQSSVKDDSIQKTLGELRDLAAQGVPSKETLLQTLAQVTKQATAQASLNNGDLSWKQRAEVAMDRFVHVQSAEQVQQKNLLHDIKQAIVVNDLANAASLTQQLPDTAEGKTLLAQIQLRQRAQTLTHQAIGTVISFASTHKGAAN